MPLAGDGLEVGVAGAEIAVASRGRANTFLAQADCPRDDAARRAVEIETERIVLIAVIEGRDAIIVGIEPAQRQIERAQVVVPQIERKGGAEFRRVADNGLGQREPLNVQL